MDEDAGRYARATGTERYLAIVKAADEVTARLMATYDVTVEDVDVTPFGGEVTRGLRIAPRNAGAPLSILVTTFPGVWASFGSSEAESFPNCGCDGCDENPDDVAAELIARIDAITRGNFRETTRGYEFTFVDGEAGRESGRVLRPAPVDYEAWRVPAQHATG